MAKTLNTPLVLLNIEEVRMTYSDGSDFIYPECKSLSSLNSSITESGYLYFQNSNWNPHLFTLA